MWHAPIAQSDMRCSDIILQKCLDDDPNLGDDDRPTDGNAPENHFPAENTRENSDAIRRIISDVISHLAIVDTLQAHSDFQTLSVLVFRHWAFWLSDTERSGFQKRISVRNASLQRAYFDSTRFLGRVPSCCARFAFAFRMSFIHWWPKKFVVTDSNGTGRILLENVVNASFVCNEI